MKNISHELQKVNVTEGNACGSACGREAPLGYRMNVLAQRGWSGPSVAKVLRF